MMFHGRDHQEDSWAQRPVAALAKDYEDGHTIPPHAHSRGQLLYAVVGMTKVATEETAWIVPPFRAVWIPPEVSHSVAMKGPVRMRTLYLDPGAATALPTACRVIEVSPLLRELILSAAQEPADYDERGRAGLIMALALQEIAAAPRVPLGVPMPRDPRLARLCHALLKRPGSPQSLEGWARQAGASSRTLARLFQADLGMTFGEWRQQALLAEGLVLLAAGTSVKEVAGALGYRSPSAFTAMFRRVLGGTPEQYMGLKGAP